MLGKKVLYHLIMLDVLVSITMATKRIGKNAEYELEEWPKRLDLFMIFWWKGEEIVCCMYFGLWAWAWKMRTYIRIYSDKIEMDILCSRIVYYKEHCSHWCYHINIFWYSSVMKLVIGTWYITLANRDIEFWLDWQEIINQINVLKCLYLWCFLNHLVQRGR